MDKILVIFLSILTDFKNKNALSLLYIPGKQKLIKKWFILKYCIIKIDKFEPQRMQKEFTAHFPTVRVA